MAALVSYPILIPDVPTIWRGQPFDWTLVMHKADGTAQDLSDYGTSWSSMLRSSQDAALSIPFTVDAAGVVDGQIVLSLTGDQTAQMQRGPVAYGFDVRATGGTVDPFYLWTGQLSVDGNFTRG